MKGKNLAGAINWRKYLSQFDLIYDSPSRVWEDGIALGNGSISAIVYESRSFYPEWIMNKNDVWDYRRPQFKRHSIDYIRQIAAKDKNYRLEMNKENIPNTGLNELPGPRSCGQLRIRFGLEKYYGAGHRITKRLGLHEATRRGYNLSQVLPGGGKEGRDSVGGVHIEAGHGPAQTGPEVTLVENDTLHSAGRGAGLEDFSEHVFRNQDLGLHRLASAAEHVYVSRLLVRAEIAADGEEAPALHP